MWQRVQTLYLAISTILIGLMFFMAKAAVYGADGSVVEQFKFTTYVPYLILLVIIMVLNILALTTWNFRVFQMRTATLTAIITLALQIWIVVDFISTHDTMVFKIAAIFPLVAVIFDVLAVRGIFADQMLVESAYHLRKSRRERRK
jgi:cytochrome c biogenesis factor